MRKRTWVLVGVAAVALVGAYALSPFLAFTMLRRAATSGDRDRLEQFVDFPVVRENLKSQVSAALLTSMSSDPEIRSNPFALVGAALVPALTDRLIDSIVTPDGIALLLREGKISKSGTLPATSGATGPAAVQVSYSYRTLDRFRAELRDRDRPDAVIALTLERRGLFGWKLIRLDIPNVVLNPASATTSAAIRNPTLDPRWDLRAYDVRQLGATVTSGKLTVRASVRNAAKQAQPVPVLRLKLQDRLGATIISRDVEPNVYLPNAPALLTEGQRVDAEMTVADPGSIAVGFEIDVCLPASGGGVTCAYDAPRR